MKIPRNLDAIGFACDVIAARKTGYPIKGNEPPHGKLQASASAKDHFVSNTHSGGIRVEGQDNCVHSGTGKDSQELPGPAEETRPDILQGDGIRSEHDRLLPADSFDGTARSEIFNDVERSSSVRRRLPRKPSSFITQRQAENLIEGLRFARDVGTPLNAHLTIHWGGTLAGDDPDGKLFAKIRNLLGKRLRRRGAKCGLVAIWVLERQRSPHTDGFSETVHGHLLFYLPSKYGREPWLSQINQVIEQLVDFVGKGIYRDRTFDLNFPSRPDGLYLLKGGTSSVQESYNVPKRFCTRHGEGLIEAKRCGTTQNIGPNARDIRYTSK